VRARRIQLCTAVALSVSVVLLGATVATGARPADPPNFHIVASGPVDFVFEPVPCGGFRITGSAAASGTHIGDASTFATSECARPDFVTGVNHVDGHAVVTADNGDQLFIHYFGDSPAPNLVTGDFHDDLAFAITGGTGHFSTAGGGGRLTAHGNIYQVPTIVSSQLDGTIDTHAS
jgi:hypothetical protein